MVHGTTLKNIELHGEKMILASFSFQISDYIKEKVSAWCYSSASIMLANLLEQLEQASGSKTLTDSDIYLEFNYSALFPLYLLLYLLFLVNDTPFVLVFVGI